MTDDDNTPSKNFTLKPDGKVNTTWAVIGSIILATGVLVGGLVSVKSDIAAAAKDAQQAKVMVEQIRDDVLRLRIALGVFDIPSSVSKPPSNKERQP